MRISTCVVSSDTNPLYLDFFPLVHATWRRLTGIRCVLLLVADAIPPALDPLADDIILVPPLSEVHPGLYAQCARLAFPQLIECPPDTAVLISDIDMLPMSSRYFPDAVAKLADDRFAVYRSNSLMRDYKEIAICYNAASPQTWRDVVGDVGDARGASETMRRWATDLTYTAVPGGAGWSTDQILLFRMVKAFDPKRVALLRDRQLGFRRLDRAHIDADLGALQRDRIERGTYADYHMKRPFAEFAALNTKIAELAVTAAAHPPRPRWYETLYRRL